MWHVEKFSRNYCPSVRLQILWPLELRLRKPLVGSVISWVAVGALGPFTIVQCTSSSVLTTKYCLLFPWHYIKFMGEEVLKGGNRGLKRPEGASSVVIQECGVPWFFMCFTSKGKTATSWLSSVDVSLIIQWYWLMQQNTIACSVFFTYKSEFCLK